MRTFWRVGVLAVALAGIVGHGALADGTRDGAASPAAKLHRHLLEVAASPSFY